jgi:5-methylcytosine-specific restriction endonuclease McrA
MPYKDPSKQKAYDAARYMRIMEQKKAYDKERYERIAEKKKAQTTDRRENVNQHAYDSITSGKIIDRYEWDRWCDEIKRSAERDIGRSKTHPYEENFTNDAMFGMMVRGCFYCGQFATTIDRLDSTLDHTLDNCVGCCYSCNTSKGAADPATFVRKAYYRARGEYIDDVADIWYENINKPSMARYKAKAKANKVSFDLTDECFENLINGDCEYCHRSPTTWFGIDRIKPEDGYVLGNVATCCFDCNVDKHKVDARTTAMRNNRIAERVDTGEIKIIVCPKTILHIGTQKSSNNVKS